MSGFLKTILALFFVLICATAEACPACMLSDKSGFINQRVWLIAVMGLLPLLLAGIVGYQIYKICRLKK